MIYLAVISLLAAIAFLFIIQNLLKKVEKYEEAIEQYTKAIDSRDDYLTKIVSLIRDSETKILKLDSSERFKTDDELQFFFENLLQIQNYMNYYAKAYIDAIANSQSTSDGKSEKR